MGVNRYIALGKIVHKMLNVANPLQDVAVYYVQSAVVDDSGQKSHVYTNVTLPARIQQPSIDYLTKNDLQLGNIYRNFIFLTEDITTTNRNLKVDGDYLLYKLEWYKVMKIAEGFQTGWQIITAQLTSRLGS